MRPAVAEAVAGAENATGSRARPLTGAVGSTYPLYTRHAAITHPRPGAATAAHQHRAQREQQGAVGGHVVCVVLSSMIMGLKACPARVGVLASSRSYFATFASWRLTCGGEARKIFRAAKCLAFAWRMSVIPMGGWRDETCGPAPGRGWCCWRWWRALFGAASPPDRSHRHAAILGGKVPPVVGPLVAVICALGNHSHGC